MTILKAFTYGVLLAFPVPAAEWFATRIQAPTYPILGNQARVEGAVRLRVVLNADGSVSRADVISGTPILARSAQQNILGWKFTMPCGNNDEPIEFTYEFTLKGQVEIGPQTFFTYEHPYMVKVESQALHWMPERQTR